jgi:hypothetical protein
MEHPWLLVFALVALAVTYVGLPLAVVGWRRYRERLRVHCPRADADAQVRVGRLSAATSELLPGRRLRLVDCSLWPDLQGCRQECMQSHRAA